MVVIQFGSLSFEFREEAVTSKLKMILIVILMVWAGTLFAASHYTENNTEISADVKLKINEIAYLEPGFSIDNPEEGMDLIRPVADPFPLTYSSIDNNAIGEFYAYCIYGRASEFEIDLGITDLAITDSATGEAISELELTAIIDEDNGNPLKEGEQRKILPKDDIGEGFVFGTQAVHLEFYTESVTGKATGSYTGTVTMYIIRN